MTTNASRRRGRLVLLAGTAALSMLLFDQTVVSVALPAIQRDLDTSSVGLQWIVNSYLLVLAALVAPAGKAIDLFGTRGMFVLGAAIFGGASLACGLAPNQPLLITARAVQGLGAALMMPAAYAGVTRAFAADRRGRALGTMSGIATIFLGLGPLLGGVFSQYLSWRLIFLINPPVALVALGAALRAGVDEQLRSRPRVDVGGAVTLACALTATVLAVMQARDWGWTSLATLATLLAGAILAVCFIAVEVRAEDPVIDPQLFQGASFSGAIVAVGAWQFLVLGVTIYAMLYLQLVLGYAPVIAGVLFLPTVIFGPPLYPFAGRLADRFGAHWFVVSGMVAMGVALLWMGFTAEQRSYAWVFGALVLFGLGRVAVLTPANKPPTRALLLIATARPREFCSHAAILAALWAWPCTPGSRAHRTRPPGRAPAGGGPRAEDQGP